MAGAEGDCAVLDRKRDARFIGVGIVKVEIEVIVVFAYEYTKNERVAVIGGGRAGLAGAALLRDIGARPFLVDDAPKAALEERLHSNPYDLDLPIYGGGLKKDYFNDIFFGPFISWRAANACGARTVVETRCTKII